MPHFKTNTRRNSDEPRSWALRHFALCPLSLINAISQIKYFQVFDSFRPVRADKTNVIMATKAPDKETESTLTKTSVTVLNPFPESPQFIHVFLREAIHPKQRGDQSLCVAAIYIAHKVFCQRSHVLLL